MECLVAVLHQLWPWDQKQVEKLQKPNICRHALHWHYLRNWQLHRLVAN